MIVEFEYTRGRKRIVQPADCLGLVLVWTRTRGSLNVLQLVFGLTLTNLSVYLRFGIRLMVETFKNDLLARVDIPCNEDIESFKVAFAERHPLLNNCWATMLLGVASHVPVPNPLPIWITNWNNLINGLKHAPHLLDSKFKPPPSLLGGHLSISLNVEARRRGGVKK